MYASAVRRISFVLAATVILCIALWSSMPVAASLLSNRSVQVSTAQVSVTAAHTFQFTFISTSNIGSVVFEYCENSPLFNEACSAPAGLDVSSATLNSQSGNIGFSFDSINSTANKIVITRASVAAAALASSYSFGNITNPSTANQTEFVRISTYASVDGSGAYTDNGAVAFATLAPFNISADVPPFLQLCVGIAVAIDCSSSSGNNVDLGTLSRTATKAGTSQFAIGTNSITGHIVYSLGTTMTSGNNAINAPASPTISIIGNNQFGINLRDNSIPNVGTNPSGSGSATPTANYNTPNLYMFDNGDDIAESALPTNYNRFTVSYIVNISSGQPPGIYSTTITYLGVANF